MKLQTGYVNSSNNGTLYHTPSPTPTNRFTLEFNKLPFDMAQNKSLHAEICSEMAQVLLDNLSPYEVGGVAVDGPIVIQMVNELISQIRGGGNRYI